MKGRKPKSATQQLADGDPQKRGVHTLEEKLAREAQARTGLPDCPKHLTGHAYDAWYFFATELGHMDIDKRPDAKALEALCSAYATALAADEEIRRDGVMVENLKQTAGGNVISLGKKPNPALTISFRAWKLFHTYCVEFGFTPVSRGRLSVDKQPKGDAQDIAALLAGPRPKREAVQ